MKLNALLLAASLGLAATPGAWAYPNPALYDNLGNTTLTEAMYETDTWGASQFTTDGNSYILKTVDLLLYRTGDTTAQLDIYSNYGNVPGTALGTLASPVSIPLNTAEKVTFTASGISLSANSTYWVVLHAPTGQLWWSYTDDSTGTGPGFSTINTFSGNGGSSWATPIDYYPNQMQVNADIAAVPEPSQWAMIGVTALGVTGYALRRRLAKTN